MTVTPAQVANTLGRSAPSAGSKSFKQWTMWIGDARLIIQSRLGDLTALDQETLDYVVREAVAERARNTREDGTTSKTVTVDDGTVTKRWEESKPSQLVIIDTWWDLLTPGVEDRGAFNILPYSLPPIRGGLEWRTT